MRGLSNIYTLIDRKPAGFDAKVACLEMYLYVWQEFVTKPKSDCPALCMTLRSLRPKNVSVGFGGGLQRKITEEWKLSAASLIVESK